jgi:hypothetical protein
MSWYKGNVHCHSTNSDGKQPPDEVARYYRAIGMDFVAVSDHNRLTPLAEYGPVLGPDFVGIPCCEYTGQKNCHVVAVDVDVAVKPDADQSGWGEREIIQDGIDRTRAAGGVPVVCHPCWNWALDAETMLELSNLTHFEVFNASPDCNSYPGFGRSCPEEIWDRLLSAGRRVFGVATDDGHWHGSPAGAGKPPTHLMSGGLGWCVIDAGELSRAALREAFEAGRFYASTGVELADYRVTDESIEIAVAPWSNEHATVEFIGRDGGLLARETGLSATYRFRGDELYVRARVADTTGCFAFTQPVFPAAGDQAVGEQTSPSV